MQAIMETGFDIIYLSTVVTLGIIMVLRAHGNRQFQLFGAMAIILGAGDAFHLVPRAYALLTDGLANHAAALGTGKLITSITMTVFYIMLYHIYLSRYSIRDHRVLTGSMYALAIGRIILCLFPQNDWLSASAPLSWGIYRNLPFAAMGILVICLFFKETRARGDKAFRHMSLAVALSFAFYIPVVLWADAYPLVGILMIPKTCAYVWIVMMGYLDMRRKLKK